LVGENVDLTYSYDHLGIDPNILLEIQAGNSPFTGILNKAERPMIILGQGALCRDDGSVILSTVRSIAEANGIVSADWNGFNVLHTAAARVAGLDLGLVPGDGGLNLDGILAGVQTGDIEILYLLGADELPLESLKEVFVVYQGHHGDVGAHVADVVLPGAAYTEKEGTYVNTEGRVQRGRRASFPPGKAKDDWAIIRALSDVLGKPLGYNDLDGVRKRMEEINSVFKSSDEVEVASWEEFGSSGKINDTPFTNCVTNFYMTNAISRASKTMASCTRELPASTPEKMRTDG